MTTGILGAHRGGPWPLLAAGVLMAARIASGAAAGRPAAGALALCGPPTILALLGSGNTKSSSSSMAASCADLAAALPMCACCFLCASAKRGSLPLVAAKLSLGACRGLAEALTAVLSNVFNDCCGGGGCLDLEASTSLVPGLFKNCCCSCCCCCVIPEYCGQLLAGC